MQGNINHSTEELIGYILREDQNLPKAVRSSRNSFSEELSQYYDCISGWNPV